MEKEALEQAIIDFVEKSPENYLGQDVALRPDLAGMRFFEKPLICYAAANDTLFTEYKKNEIIGPHHLSPAEWLTGAKTVISIFLPFTAQIRTANRQSMELGCDEWVHGRIEGQLFQNSLCRFIEETLKKEGFSALAPMTDPKMGRGSAPDVPRSDERFHTSNWSERHAAYAAGLGTFSLSKGLITQKGVAGRYISVITNASFEPDTRSYKGLDDYCIKCGACMRNCKGNAITMENGKLHYPCTVFQATIRAQFEPRFGCGKCQVKVPCEEKVPLKQ